jgi:purine-binding chemotaxis protein CheW
MNVVVRGGEGVVNLVVDAIGDVVEADEAQFEPPPDTLSGEARRLIRGAYKLKDRLLLALDAETASDYGTCSPIGASVAV